MPVGFYLHQGGRDGGLPEACLDVLLGPVGWPRADYFGLTIPPGEDSGKMRATG